MKEELSQSRLNQILLDHMPCVALLVRPSSREIVASNQAAVKVGAVPGTTCFATWGEREAPCPWCLAPELWKTGQAQRLEVEAAGVVWDAHWAPVGPDLYLHYAFDITERKRTEEALRASDETLRTLLNAVPESIFLIDADRKIVAANETLARRIGKSPEELIGAKIAEAIPAESAATRVAYADEVFRTGQAVRFEDIRNGRSFDNFLHPIMDGEGKVSRIGVFSLEVTEGRQAEKTLRETERRFREITENTQEWVWEVDTAGKYTYVSPLVEKLLGYKPEEVLGKQFYDLFYPEDREWLKKLAFEVFAAEQPFREFINRNLHKDGSIVWLSTSGVPILNEAGKLLGYRGSDIDITRRQLAEEALAKNHRELQETAQRLEQSRNMLHLIIESIPVRVFWKDINSRYLGCNTLFARDAGLSKPEELIGRDDFAMGWREQAESYRADDRQVMESRRPKINIIEPQTTPAGAQIWLNTSKAPLQKPDGEVFGVLGVYEDITERKRAGEAQAEEAIWRRILIEQSRDGIVILEENGKVYEANQRYAEMLGYSAEEVRQLYVWDWDSQFTREQLNNMLRSVDAAGDHFETSHRRKDGSFLDVEISTNGAVVGGRKLIFCVCRDISQRKAAEQALRESEEKYRLVFEKAPLGIMHYDLTSTITDCNEKFSEIIGAPAEKFIGFNMIRQLTDEKMREAVIASLKGEVGYYEGDYISVSAGKTTPVRAIFQPIFPSNGIMSGGVTIFEDITERKKAEAERLRFSKLESLGLLAGGIAHDFNNILTAIIGNISLAMLDLKLGDQVQERLREAEIACQQAQTLARQLLTFAKGGAPVKKITSLATIINESVLLSCRGSQARCEFRAADNLWLVEADAGQISQVFQNLIINAVQAMPAGGNIYILAANAEAAATGETPAKPAKYVKVTIQDQGIGIPPKYLPKIFDPYFTTKQSGSGLGLATAYSIIKNHRGEISVESTLGVGTTFSISLPASEQVVAPHPGQDRILRGGKGKILAMDDEEMVCKVLGRMLANLGYEVELAQDGAEALKKFTEAHSRGEKFAAVILDLTVPGGLGGKETVAKLLEINPQVKAIVSSGYSDDPIMADPQKYGFCGVIAKPYKVLELSKILHDTIVDQSEP